MGVSEIIHDFIKNLQKNMDSYKLHSAIKQSLRRCDTFTRFSPSQFLILLVGTEGESCKGIFDPAVFPWLDIPAVPL